MSNWNSRGNRGDNRGSYRGASDREEPQQQRFPNSGALFPLQNRRSDNSPDMTGNILIADEVLDYIVREAQNGNEVQLDMSAWQRISRNNTNFTSLKINIPYNVRMEEQGNPTYRARPNFNKRPQRQRDDDRGDPQGNRYSQQSGRGGSRNAPPRRDDDFAKGDSMPDFLRDDDGDEEPPF
jgi:hypothetical protein